MVMYRISFAAPFEVFAVLAALVAAVCCQLVVACCLRAADIPFSE